MVAVRGPVNVSSRKSYEAVGGSLLAFIRCEANVRSCLTSGLTRLSSQRSSSVLSGSKTYGPRVRVISCCTRGQGLFRLLASMMALRLRK